MCGICDITNSLDDFDNPFNQIDMDGFINGVWLGEYTKHKLPKNIYAKTAEKLNSGVFKGYGKDFLTVDYDSPDLLMLEDLTTNIYMFSGAKTYQMTRISEAVKKNASNFYNFKKEAETIFKNFNDNYLQAEFQTTIASSRMAGNWQRLEALSDVAPLLKYQTVGDDRVRETHKKLDGIVRPINDKFWDSYYPINGWRCRCEVIQLSEDEAQITDLRGFKKPNDVPDEFMMNSGKDRIVFSKKHAYFDVAKGDKKFAQNNFDLPIPKKNDKLDNKD